MNRHAHRPTSTPLSCSLVSSAFGARAATAALASAGVLLGGCGGGTQWKPVPVASIPVAPNPPPPSETGGIWAWKRSLAEAAAAEARAKAPKPKAAPPPATAIGGELPKDLDVQLAVNDACAKKECALEDLFPKGAAPDAKSPAAIWSHDLSAKGNTLTLPRAAGVEVYGVVVKGAAKVRGGEAAKSVAVPAWGAFVAPGGGVSITAEGGPARVVLVVVTGGEPVAEAAEKLHAKNAPKLAWKARPAPIAIVDLGAAKDMAWAGGSMHARTAFDGDKRKASLGVLMGSKDARVAPHLHEGSWEIAAMLRASGSGKRASAPGGTELMPVPLSDGGLFVVPKGTLHAWEGGGTATLVAVQVYVPPGPEQRFKKLAAEASAPATTAAK